MRASREHIQGFLYDWLGIKLSVGTINNTLHESSAAAMPLEDAFIQEIINSELLHVDETILDGTYDFSLVMSVQYGSCHSLLDCHAQC